MENPNEFGPTPESIAAGLMVEKGGEACMTGAGLFAMAGAIAHTTDAAVDSRVHCMRGFLQALDVARACGLREKSAQVIQWAFAKGITPGDGSPEGVALATLCKLVAELVGTGRMEHLIAGNPAH